MKWKRVRLERKVLRRRNSSLYIHLHSSKATFWWHKGSVKDKQLKSSSCQCLCGCLGIPKFPPQKKDWRPKKGKRAFTTLQRNYVEAANTLERRKRGGGTIRWSLARKLIIHSSLPFLEQIHSFSFLSYMTVRFSKKSKNLFLLFGNQFTQANKYAGTFLFFWCCIANYNFVRLRDLLFLYSLVHSMIM